MEKLNSELVTYIETSIFPEYQKNEPAHSIDHIHFVIDRSFQLSKNIADLDPNIIFTVAAFHDIAHHIDRDNHEVLSAKMFYEDENVKKWFNDSQRKLIKEAIEDHRSTLETEPRSIYGKIVSSADRQILDTRVALLRPYVYGLQHFPALTKQGQIDRTFTFLTGKYGENGYAKMYIKDEQYETSLANLRKVLHDKELFLKIMNEVVYNYEQKVQNEKRAI